MRDKKARKVTSRVTLDYNGDLPEINLDEMEISDIRVRNLYNAIADTSIALSVWFTPKDFLFWSDSHKQRIRAYLYMQLLEPNVEFVSD